MTNLQRLIHNIRVDIPDPTEGDDTHLDGRAYSLQTILGWINDAGDVMCHKANIISDWYAIPTVADQDVYELPDYITSVEQVFFNLLPLDRSSTQENMFTVKRSGSSWWFSPYDIGIIPRLFLFPAPSVAAATDQLNGSLSSTATTLTVDSTTGFNAYGYLKIDDEIIRYAKVTSATVIGGLLRGQCGTTATAHSDNAVVVDQNLVMKCFRLPRQVENADGVLEIPRGLHPLIQLYVASRVISAEQDKQAAAQLRNEFFQLVDQLSARPATQGIRQGRQVMTWPNGGTAANTRLLIP